MTARRAFAWRRRSVESKVMDRLLRAVTSRPRLTLWLIGASVIVALWPARTIELRFQYRDFYDYPGNPGVRRIQEYNRHFGDYAFIMILLEGQELFSPTTLRFVDDVTRGLAHSSVYARVLSVTNATELRAAGDAVQSGPLMARLPGTVAAAKRLRTLALSSPQLRRRLVSDDGSAMAILAELREPTSLATVDVQRQAIAVASEVLAQRTTPAGVRVSLSGAPAVEVQTTRALLFDQWLLTPLVVTLIALALLFTFRSMQGVILPLTAVLVSLAWTAGVFSRLGRPLDIIGSTIPISLLVYGVVDPVFVLGRYYDKLALGCTRIEAVRRAYAELITPCFLTSLTTATGFAAFAGASLPTVRVYGITVAVGVLCAFVTTVAVLPALLMLTRPPAELSQRRRLSALVDRAMIWIWRTVRPRRAQVMGFGGAVIALGIWAGLHLEIANEYVGSLPEGETLRSVRVIEDKLSGVVPIAVVLEGPADSMKRPAVLRALSEVDAQLEDDPAVNVSLSLADVLAQAHQAFDLGNPGSRAIPDSPGLIAQYLSLLDPAARARLVTEDYAKAQFLVMVDDTGSPGFWRVHDKLERALVERLGPLGVSVSVTGAVEPYRALDQAVREVLWGFVLAFGTVVALELLVFRSLRAAVLSIIPNLLPVASCLIGLRLCGSDLRIDNVLVLCISIGGLFNTTIHLVSRIMQQLRSGRRDPDAIVERALRDVGPASLYTATVLSLGFGALSLSQFSGLRMLGLMSMLTLLTGFIADATVTAALMRSYFVWRREPDARRLAPAPGSPSSGDKA